MMVRFWNNKYFCIGYYAYPNPHIASFFFAFKKKEAMPRKKNNAYLNTVTKTQHLADELLIKSLKQHRLTFISLSDGKRIIINKFWLSSFVVLNLFQDLISDVFYTLSWIASEQLENYGFSSLFSTLLEWQILFFLRGRGLGWGLVQ